MLTVAGRILITIAIIILGSLAFLTLVAITH